MASKWQGKNEQNFWGFAPNPIRGGGLQSYNASPNPPAVRTRYREFAIVRAKNSLHEFLFSPGHKFFLIATLASVFSFPVVSPISGQHVHKFP